MAVFCYAVYMLSLFQIFLIFLSALTIIVADAFIKKVSGSSFRAAFTDPWMILVYILYFSQIIISIYIFLLKSDLAIYANFYIIFYSILSVVISVIAFHEHLSWVQFLGIGLAIIGAVLMNSK